MAQGSQSSSMFEREPSAPAATPSNLQGNPSGNLLTKGARVSASFSYTRSYQGRGLGGETSKGDPMIKELDPGNLSL